VRSGDKGHTQSLSGLKTSKDTSNQSLDYIVRYVIKKKKDRVSIEYLHMSVYAFLSVSASLDV